MRGSIAGRALPSKYSIPKRRFYVNPLGEKISPWVQLPLNQPLRNSDKTVNGNEYRRQQNELPLPPPRTPRQDPCPVGQCPQSSVTDVDHVRKRHRASSMNNNRNQHYIPKFVQRAFWHPQEETRDLAFWLR